MDNITHSIIGLAVAEGAVQLRRRSGKKAPLTGAKPRGEDWRGLFWTLSLVANNFPDLDFLYAGFSSGKLGYLLQHRGFTHTLALVIPQALLILGIARGYAALRNLKWPRADWLWASALVVLGLLLHVSFDYLNSYGVHPFWPWENRWHYGDTLFIVEPWLWVALLPALILCGISSFWRSVNTAIFLLALALCWLTPFVPWQLALAITVFGIGFWAAIRKRLPGFRIAAGLTAAGAIIAGFALSSMHVRAEIEKRRIADESSYRLLDIVLSPLPANPFCWTFITIERGRESGGDAGLYRMKSGLFALAPSLIPLSACPRLRSASPRQARQDGDSLLWESEYRAPIAPLAEARKDYCGIAALLQFARAPFLSRQGKNLVVGDLRFSRGGKSNFSEIEVSSPKDECPNCQTPWEDPRADLFR